MNEAYKDALRRKATLLMEQIDKARDDIERRKSYIESLTASLKECRDELSKLEGAPR